MDAAALLTSLHLLGVDVATDGRRIFATPRHVLTDELCARIRQHRAELIAALTLTASTIAKCSRRQAASPTRECEQGELFAGLPGLIAGARGPQSRPAGTSGSTEPGKRRHGERERHA